MGLGIGTALVYYQESIKKRKSQFAALNGKVVPKDIAVNAMQAELKTLDEQEALLLKELENLEEAGK